MWAVFAFVASCGAKAIPLQTPWKVVGGCWALGQLSLSPFMTQAD